MKNIFIKLMLCLFIVGMASCEKYTELENIEVLKPYEKSDAYYANLKAYKKSEHKIAFGWFGGWTAMGASTARYLSSVPDSVDIISIWGAWTNLSQNKKDDIKYVQEVKGTKVIFTTFAHTIPQEFYPEGGNNMDDNIPEGIIETYAKALADSVSKYGYDGIDFDYEPGFGGRGPLINKANMEKFIREMSKYVGPASGTGLLLCIDGVPGALNPGLAELFDYGICQAYYCRSASNLQSRFDEAARVGWKPEQYIFTEDFERGWSTGGESFTDYEGNVMPSLIGMALFEASQGPIGGFGTYHMEYEYNHSDNIDYKYLRRGIQLANPANH